MKIGHGHVTVPDLLTLLISFLLHLLLEQRYNTTYFMNEEEFTKLTKLCRLSCTEEEKEDLLKSISNILEYDAKLQEIDTAGVPSCNTVLANQTNVLREDVPGEILELSDVFKDVGNAF